MHHDDLAVGGELYVEFEEIRAAADGLFEGEQRIFRSIAHRPAVPDHETRRLMRPKV
jgi:hypothetical protein